MNIILSIWFFRYLILVEMYHRYTLANIIQAMFCNAPYFDTDTILRATHFTCVSLILFGIAFVGHVIWREERRSRQKSRAFSYFACVDVSWRQSGRSGWYGLQVLTCDAHNKRWWRWLYFLLTTWESELRFFLKYIFMFEKYIYEKCFYGSKNKKENLHKNSLSWKQKFSKSVLDCSLMMNHFKVLQSSWWNNKI